MKNIAKTSDIIIIGAELSGLYAHGVFLKRILN